MINRDFYREMIGQYSLVSNMPDGEDRAEAILESIFSHIQLDKNQSHSEGVVEGLERGSRIANETIEKMKSRQIERHGSE